VTNPNFCTLSKFEIATWLAFNGLGRVAVC